MSEWQTRQTQNLLSERACGFESHRRHFSGNPRKHWNTAESQYLRGFTTFYDKEAEIDRLMLEHSATKIIAADSSKLGRTAFAHIAPLNMADYIVTNADESKNADIAAITECVSNIIVL